MSVGELWVKHPLFPWIMIVLALWTLCSTIVMARNWRLIQKLKRLIEKVENLVEKIRDIQNPCQSVEHKECSTRVRIEETEAPAIEEADENGDVLAAAKSKDKERTSVRNT